MAILGGSSTRDPTAFSGLVGCDGEEVTVVVVGGGALLRPF